LRANYSEPICERAARANKYLALCRRRDELRSMEAQCSRIGVSQVVRLATRRG